MRSNDAAFEDWKNRAADEDLLETAKRLGATLKRAGQEWVGPCPSCGGSDRFAVNPSKRKWICRGHGGGSTAINLAMHAGEMSYLEALEFLTGEKNPSGREARPLSDEEKQARADRRKQLDEQRARDEEDQERKAARRSSLAGDIWRSGIALPDTVAEKYLLKRGIPVPPEKVWPDCVRFIPKLEYPSDMLADPSQKLLLPALIARVDRMDGNPCAIWRIFLDEKTADKANVPNAKLGLGPALGGAVRIGGVAEHVDTCEGLETGFAVRCITAYRRPCWPGLSTSGLVGIEFPLVVNRATCWPDGDLPIKHMKDEDEWVLTFEQPPGIAAAYKARDRYEGILRYDINEPPHNADFLNVWNSINGRLN